MIIRKTIKADSSNLTNDPIQEQLSEVSEDLFNSFLVSVNELNNGLHEILIVGNKSTDIISYPEAGHYYKPNIHPEVIRFYCKDGYASGTINSASFKFDNTSFPNSSVKLEDKDLLAVWIKTGLLGHPSTGSHYFTCSGLYNNKGEPINLTWNSMVSKDFVLNDNKCCNDYKARRVKLIRINESNSNDFNIIQKEGVKVLKNITISNNQGLTKRWTYIFYTEPNIYDVISTLPENNGVITNSEFKYQIKFGDKILHNNDISNKFYTTSFDGIHFYSGLNFTVNHDLISIGLPNEGLTEGFHFVKFIGSGIYFHNGNTFNKVKYFCYYKTNNILENIINVSGGTVSGQVLGTDGQNNWYPITVTLTGSSGGPSTGDGSMWDLGSITEPASSIFDFGGLS